VQINGSPPFARSCAHPSRMNEWSEHTAPLHACPCPNPPPSDDDYLTPPSFSFPSWRNVASLYTYSIVPYYCTITCAVYCSMVASMYSEFLAIGQKRKQGINQYCTLPYLCQTETLQMFATCLIPSLHFQTIFVFVSEDEEANCMRWRFISIECIALQSDQMIPDITTHGRSPIPKMYVHSLESTRHSQAIK